MKTVQWNDFITQIKESKKTPLYYGEKLKISFAADVDLTLRKKGISNVQFSTLLDTNKSYVTKVLSGDANLTLESIAKIALALGMEAHIQLTPKDHSVRFDFTIPIEQKKSKAINTSHWFTGSVEEKRYAIA